MALAHELRELRCRVAPIIITPCSSALEEGGREGGREGEDQEEGEEGREEMFSLARLAGARSRRSPLFVLCVDGTCGERGRVGGMWLRVGRRGGKGRSSWTLG